MLKNFLKTTLRNIWKNKSYMIINVVGLSLCLACCIVAYLNYKFANDFDKNHVSHEQIYKIQINKTNNDYNQPYGITPLALGPAITGEFAGVTHYTRYTNPNLVLKKDLKLLDKNVGFADDDFFEMFTFPFKYGTQESFFDKSNIILSEETAIAYFGDIDPTGELLTLIEDDGTEHSMRVGGVLEKIPLNSMIRFDALIHFDEYLDRRETDNNNWGTFVAGTFFMTDSDEFPDYVQRTINEKYISIQNEARPDWLISSYYLEPLTDLAKNSENVWANWLNFPPPPPAITTPFIMAILMLLIACFNFTNTSIAISSKRLKEIGIRKVMGSSRRQVIYQFMGENIILVFISMVFALAIAKLLVPAYSALWDFIDLELSLFSNPEIYLFLLGLLLFTAFIAGAYPSLYISSFQPVNILRGNLSLGSIGFFSKALLTTQYALTTMALIGSFAFTQNAKYQESLDVGFDKSNIIGVRVESQSDYERFRNVVDQMPGVMQTAGTSNHIGRWNYGRTLRNGEKELELGMMDFGVEYLDIMDLEMVEGRYFSEDTYESDRLGSIIVNEQLVDEFGWEEPIGQVLMMDTIRFTVIGVMQNFHMWGFWNPINPMGIRLAGRDRMNFVVVKANTGQLSNTYSELESKWYDVSPSKPFDGRFMDEELKESSETNKNISMMFSFLGGLALVLSTIGLYTLVSLTVIKRVKEIGIRRVLGASVNNILQIMNRPFYLMLLIAAVIGSTLSYFAIDGLMASIWAYYKALSPIAIALPLLILFLVSIATASYKVFTAAVRNPVDSLRYE